MANVEDSIWKPIKFYEDKALDLMRKITLTHTREEQPRLFKQSKQILVIALT